MSDYIVMTAFRARDQMSKDLKKMGLSAKHFGRTAERAFKRAEGSALSLKTVIGGILGAAVLRRGFSALTQGVRTVASEFIDFDDSITAAATKFGVFDRSSKTFKDLAKTAREVGAATEFTSPQAAEGLRFLAKAGWKANAAMKALPSFVDLATASEMEFSRAADIATDTMGAFRMQSEDAEQNLVNLTRINDVMAKAVNMSNIDMEDLFETIKMAGPIASTAGISIEKFGAMAAFVGGAGIKGSLGGTALRTMFLSLAAPTTKIKNKFKSLGIQLMDVNGNLRDPVAILGQLNRKFKDMGTAQKAAALNLIFGKRAVSGAAVSMDGATTKLLEFEETLLSAGGASKKMAEAMRKSLGNRLEALKSAAIELGFKVLDAFATKFPGGIDAATEALRNFDVKPVVKAIQDAATSIRDLVDVMRSAYKIGKDYKGVLIGIGAAFGAMKLTSVVLAFMSIAKFVTAMKAAGGIVGAIAAVGIAPLVLAIGAAVGGLAAGVWTVYENWTELKIVAKEFIDWAGKGLSAFGETVKGVFTEVWYNIKSGFASVLELIMSAGREMHLDKVLDFSGAEMLVKTLRSVEKTPGTGSQPYQAKPLIGASEALAMQGTITTPGPTGGWSLPQASGKGPGKNFAAPPTVDAKFLEVQREQAKAAKVDFRGQLDITGAPQGSKVSGKTKGAPPIRTNLLGANP